MTTSREFKGLRQKLVAGFLGLIPGLFAGVLFTQAQKRDLYPFYDNYQQRWRDLDPLWAEFTDKVREKEESQDSELQRRLEEEQAAHLDMLRAERSVVNGDTRSEEEGDLLITPMDNESDKIL